MMLRKPRVVQAIKFRILPALDTVLMFEGQRYLAVGSKLHTNAKGALVPLIEWRSHCATCGDPFNFFTKLQASHPNRRCPSHHKPRQPVSAAGRVRQRNYKTSRRPKKPTR